MNATDQMMVSEELEFKNMTRSQISLRGPAAQQHSQGKYNQLDTEILLSKPHLSVVSIARSAMSLTRRTLPTSL